MYTFHLEKVLNYRKKNEELAQERLAGVIRETEAARDALQYTQNAFSLYQNEYTGLQARPVNPAHLMQASEYAGHLADLVRQKQTELTQKETELLQEKQDTEKAMQERKVMDTLREKDFLRYRRRLTIQEQRENDEIAQTVYLRNNKS